MASSAASRVAMGVGKHALSEAALLAAKKASMKGLEATGNSFLMDQVDQYKRDVIKPGVDMLPWNTEGNDSMSVMGLTNETIGEQLGLLKYIQDNTVQPWIDLAQRGYDGFNERHESGLLADRSKSRRLGQGGRVSEKPPVQKGEFQNRVVRPLPISARFSRNRG